jgi:hypothetical protein
MPMISHKRTLFCHIKRSTKLTMCRYSGHNAFKDALALAWSRKCVDQSCWIPPIRLLIEAHTKSSVAAKPSAVRPACNVAHFSIKARVCGPALAGSVAMSLRFGGMMPRSV